MSQFNENFAAMLRSARSGQGMSQTQAAESLGVSRSAYAYYETGKTLPELEKLAALKELLHMPAKAFLYPERYVNGKNRKKSNKEKDKS